MALAVLAKCRHWRSTHVFDVGVLFSLAPPHRYVFYLWAVANSPIDLRLWSAYITQPQKVSDQIKRVWLNLDRADWDGVYRKMWVFPSHMAITTANTEQNVWPASLRTYVVKDTTRLISQYLFEIFFLFFITVNIHIYCNIVIFCNIVIL